MGRLITISINNSKEIILTVSSYGTIKRELVNTLAMRRSAYDVDDFEEADMLSRRAEHFAEVLRDIERLAREYAPYDAQPYGDGGFVYERDFLRYRFIKGMAMDDIAEAMHVGRSTVYRIARHMGIHTVRKGMKYKRSGPHKYKITKVIVAGR